ncbi:hypothetical protein FBU30_002663 [Linnemannia zychae]|nr:hypothetical protein FBU30_002663 [Linnemannia zychae]
MAQEDEDSHPIVKSSALGEALSLEEGQRNEPGVRIKEKQFVNRDIQEQQQGGLNSTRVQQFDGYDLTKNEGPSTFIQDRLRSSKTLPPSLEQQYQIPDINSMKSENRPTSMVAEHLIGPGVIKLEDGLVPILGENSQSNELSVEGIHSDIISIEAPSPPPSPPPLPQILPSDFYNQTYVDGTWGAGIFVQDRIQIDNTLPNEANDLNYHKNGDGSSSKSTSHSVMATFLDVIQDNLELVQGYDGRISGLLGLTRGSPTGRKTFLQELVDQGSLHEPVVSMYLSTDGGSFLLGGIDPTQFLGELVYSPVTDPIAWQISLRGLGIRYRNNENGSNSLVPNSNSLPSLPPIINSSRTFDSYRQHYQQRRRLRRHLPSTDSIMHLSTLPLTPKTFPTTAKATYPSGRDETFKILPQLNIFQDAPLILDSGTSSILIPSDASQVIHSELHGNWDPIHQTWFLPCQGPDLIWWVSATHGIIQPYESLIYLLEDGRCQSLIFENPNADFWILGDTWLRGLYV